LIDLVYVFHTKVKVFPKYILMSKQPLKEQ